MLYEALLTFSNIIFPLEAFYYVQVIKAIDAGPDLTCDLRVQLIPFRQLTWALHS